MRMLLSFILFIPFVLQAQNTYNYLQIQHPQQTWRYGQGTIDQAVLSIRPKGSFVQQDLYMTISAKGLSFTSSDSVEIQMEFALPKEAVVTDLWLWMDDNSIMKGLLMDRWTASSIYENIVKRRRDPALLMKNSDLQYTLRIYPMVGNKSRKIKISYVVPVSNSTMGVAASLPFNIIKTSKTAVPKTTVLYWPEGGYTSPSFLEFSNGFEKTARLDTVTGKQYFYGEVPATSFTTTVTLQSAAPNKTVAVARYSDPLKQGEGYFQVSFNPANVFGIDPSQKLVILFEFDENRSVYSTISLLNTMKTFLLANLSKRDSVNFIFSGSQIKRLKNSGWFGGDTASINGAFDLITQNMLQNASNVQALLSDGIDFVRQNGNTGILWLISASDAYNSYSIVNPAIQSIAAQLKPVIPIHITDVTSYNVAYSYFNNKYYYGNDYFYENIARISTGLFTSYRQNSVIQNNLLSVLAQVRGTIRSFDMITRIENGFCSNRYTTGIAGTGEIVVDRTITQVGRYIGEFPFVLELAGIYRGQTKTAKLTVHDSSFIPMDKTLETIWAGNYIASMEALPVTNSLTSSIIDVSLTYRVLSRYTAFLALEPNDTLKACLTCRDESKLVAIGTRPDALVPQNDSLLSAYPNPFNPETTLRVRLPHGVKADESSLRIYNVLGQAIRSLDIHAASSGSETNVQWNGTSDNGVKVSSGVYLAVLSTPHRNFTVKLLMTK